MSNVDQPCVMYNDRKQFYKSPKPTITPISCPHRIRENRGSLQCIHRATKK